MNSDDILRKSSNWSNYKTRLQPLNDKQKGDCFEQLTKYYLQLHPTYATQLKNVWVLKEVPPRIRKHLNLPEPDEGIDLIAETKDGGYWAIQCKYKTDETKSLTRKELSTFTDLAFNICKNIELGLVCTTADRFSRKLTLYGEKLTFCAGDKWRELDASFFRRLHRHLGGKPALLKPYTARPHQRSAINSAYRHYHKEGNKRGKLIMPCGTGKSLTGYWIAKKLGGQKILIAVPSLALIRQTLEVWARESLAHKQDVSWIAVCSDETVGQIERDDIAVLTQDLGVRVHTDPKEIARWLRAHQGGPMVVFTTYQSGRVTAEAARKARLSFDVGILDEAHKTVGKQDSLFSHLLHDGNIKVDKRIFMTATERRYRGRSDQIASMDDPNLYGEDFELLSFKRALEADPPILSDYKIITIGVTHEEIADLIERNAYVKPDKGKWDDEVEAEMLAGVIALRKAMKKERIYHAVSFHSSIARARAFKATQDSFTAAFPAYGKLETFHVSGNTPTAVRSRELDEFAASKRSLITNARCLMEGVDVPDIDCVLFADPKRSTVDIVQAVGRALRTAEGKKYGYVVVPVLLEDDLEDSKAFEPVLTILRALAANDDRIVEYFRRISEGRKIKGGSVEFSIDIPQGFTINTDDFVNSVEVQFWSRLARLSWRPFDEARDYVHGLSLRSQKEWSKFCNGKMPNKGFKPNDIPRNPHTVYKDKGWIGFGDWLGTGAVAPSKRQFIPFNQARAFVHRLNQKSQTEWDRYCRGKLLNIGTLPENIPSHPGRTYKNEGWVGFGDWLGTGRVADQLKIYRSFKQARNFAHSLGLKTYAEWKKYCLGELPIKGKKPDDIPINPHKTYRGKGWISTGDWLGTGTVATYKRQYRPFRQARSFVRSLNFNSETEWRKYCNGKLPEKGVKPIDIPRNAHQVYKGKGWSGMGDWLGTGTVASYNREYRPYKEARAYVRKLGLKSATEWIKYCKGAMPNKGIRPHDIPSNPNQTYRDNGWIGYGDWLGTGTVATYNRQYRPFRQARNFVHSLGIKTVKDWQQYCAGNMPDKEKRPDDIPSHPDQTYINHGWKGYGDWLGTQRIGNTKRKFRSYVNARAYVRKLGLKTQVEWNKYCKGEMPNKGSRPFDIPSNPQQIYKDKGWISTGDWLGTEVVATSLHKYRTFRQARAYVRSLELLSQKDWAQYCRGEIPEKGKKPDDIPTNPHRTYKDQGWSGMRDWLGVDNKRRYKSKKK